MRLFASVLLLFAGACMEPIGPHHITLDIDESSPIAIGSRLTARFMNRGPECDDVGLCLDWREVEIKEYSVDPPELFEVTQGDEELDFLAVGEGASAFLTTVESNGETRTFVRNLMAKAIDAVVLHTSCQSPALMQAGIETALGYELRGDGMQLHGKGLMPLTVTGGRLLPPDEYGTPWLELPSAPGTVVLTSPYDPDFVYEIDAVTPDSIDGIAITDPQSPLRVGNLTDVSAELFVGTRSICDGSRPVRAFITTSDICAIEPGYGTNSDTIRIRGLAAGECTLNVMLGGTSIIATKTFPITI